MDRLKLEFPTAAREKEAFDFLQEFYDYNSELNGTGGLQRFEGNYSGWLKKLDDDLKRIPDEERVPAETYFLVRESDNRIIGMINIRLVLNQKLREFGGNIGYSIRPTERQKGYNKVNLYLALCVCKNRGIESVLIGCDKDNPGSAKTIQALGGELIREYFDEKNNITIQNYTIDINKAIEKYRDKFADKISEYPK